jgi:hypothetical protein
LQNCSNFDAGEFAGGAVSFVGESGVAPPVWGAAAPPCGVPGFAWVVVDGVVVVAVVVDVEVSVVEVSVPVELSTVGVFDSPGTVSVGAVVGRGSDALLLSPPHAPRKGTRAVRASANATRRMIMGSAFDGREPAAAGRAIGHVLGRQLLQRAPAQAQVLDRPGQAALAGRQRQDLPHDGELFTRLAVDVHGSGLDLADDLAIGLGAQAI